MDRANACWNVDTVPLQGLGYLFRMRADSRKSSVFEIVFASKAIFIGDEISARFGAKDAFNR
jgi:hypothetical protein